MPKNNKLELKYGSKCDCCLEENHSDSNPIISCCQCDTSVHTNCYFIDTIPTTAW